nr:hypothetical protein [Tanacetum cinerariifolium]
MVVRCYLPGHESSVSSESNSFVTHPGAIIIQGSVGNKMLKAFPLPVMSSHYQTIFPLLSERDAPAEEVCTAYEEVIGFGDSYEAPQEVADTGSASKGSTKKKGRTVAVTIEDMQKRKNDVKARTTLLLALPDEHQLRFSKYKTTQELWAAITKTFGGNEATKKTKKNQLKQQYGNFKAKGKETLEKTFNRLQAIVSHLKFMDVKIEQDDLNHKFLTSLAPEWLMYTIVWRNRSDLDTMTKTSSGKEEVNTASFSTASTQVSPTSADVATASFSHDTVCAYIASQSNGSQVKYEDINHIDEDDIEEMDIKWNMALLKCRAPRSQDRGRRENFKQGSKTEEQTPKALMVIDEVGWDWSYMASEEENHALVADQEAPKEFALMAKSSYDNEVFDNSLYSKACKKNTDSLNTKITELSEKLSDTKNTLHHYKLGLSQVEARLVKFKNQKIKFCKKIRGLEFKVESKDNRIERLTNELEELKKEKEGLDSKLFPPPAQVYSPPKKDMSWTGLPKFADDTISDYSRPSPSIGSNSSDLQNSNSSVFENDESSESIMSKPMIKFVKAADSPTVIKTNKVETVRKPSVKYAKMYRDTHKSPKIMSLMMEDMFHLDNWVARLLGKQRKASCKTKLVHLVTKPLHTLHMDLFGPTSDETSGILRNFITEIENLKELKVKTIRCDNGGEFRNKEMNDFCSKKGIKRDFNNARTPQQNGVTDGRNKTLIEAAITMSADVKLPVTFWAEAVNTACYVQNRVLGSLMQKGMKVILLVVVAGTTSTYFSGTKDAASQDEKKDVSSLRYIALSNWFHEAHLESSTTNAQDACNADALESSGNSNPTSTSIKSPG